MRRHLCAAVLLTALAGPAPAAPSLDTLSRALSHGRPSTALPPAEVLAERSAPVPAPRLNFAVRANVTNSVGPVIETLPAPTVAPGAFVRYHQLAEVAMMTTDGRTLWRRGIQSMYANFSWKQNGWQAPVAPMYQSLLDPTQAGSRRVLAVGDLSGDGIEDVAVTFLVRTNGGYDKPFDYSMQFSVVLVLDGRSGRTLWKREFPAYVQQLVLQGTRLIVANKTGDHILNRIIGLDGSVSTLYAYRFARTAAGLRVTPAWSRAATPWANWLDLTAAGPDALAAAWSDTPFPSTAPVSGHLLLLDAASGALRWSRDTEGYPRALHYDAARDELAAGIELQPVWFASPGFDLLQTGYAGYHFSYALQSYARSDGRLRLQQTHGEAILETFEIGDASGDGKPEWFASEITYTNPGPLGDVVGPQLTGNRVYALDADAGAALWSADRPFARDSGAVDADALYETVAGTRFLDTPAGPRLLVSTFLPFNQWDLQLVDARSGAALWKQSDPEVALYPLYPALVRDAAGTPVLVGFGALCVQRTASLADGTLVSQTPLFGQMFSVDAADLNGDGLDDLVTGGESGGIFALDNKGLQENPRVLWMHRMRGQVQKVKVADVDGDGAADVVALAALTHGEQHLQGAIGAGADVTGVLVTVDVLRGSDGSLLQHHELPDQLAWTFTLGDLDGDGATDIVVPTRSVTAFSGKDGRTLWTFQPAGFATVFSELALAPGPRVVGQFLIQGPATEPSLRHVDPVELGLINLYKPTMHSVAFALDAASGTPQWLKPAVGQMRAPELWRGVVAGPEVPVAGGYGMAVASDHLADPIIGADTTVYTYNDWIVDVLDVRTGDPVMTAPAATYQSGYFGMSLLPDVGVISYSAVTRPVTCLSWSHGVGHPQLLYPFDVTAGHFGGGGTQIVMASYAYIKSFDADGCGQDSGFARQTGYFPPNDGRHAWPSGAGSLLAHDLNHDGIDELITVPFNYAGFHNATGMQAGGAVSQQYDDLKALMVFKVSKAP